MYSIKLFTQQPAWDDFVDAAQPNTFLHAWAWGQTEEMSGRRVYRFGVYENEQLVAVVLAVVIRARRGTLVVCPHGPIFASGLIEKSRAAILKLIRDRLMVVGKSEKAVAVRICPILSDTPLHRQLFSALGFRTAPIHLYSERSWILDITLSEEALLAGMKKHTRYGIRKAERDGITIRASTAEADLELFWRLYAETAARQHFVPYSKKAIAAEFKSFAPFGRARWYFAYYKNEPIATALIIDNAHSAFYHHGASIAHASITPGELLQWQVIRDAKARGLRCYDFWGVVADDSADHAWVRLSRFKKGFGGEAHPYVPAQDYTLSPKYVITYVIETLRKWKRNV